MTRRAFLASTAASTQMASPPKFKMAVEGYIFQQYAQSQKRNLAAVTSETLHMARLAGFKNIELNSAFFAPALREQTIAVLQAEDLRMPSVYVGGTLHEAQEANETMSAAVEFGKMCRPFGCEAIVTNPDPKPGGTAKTDAELNIQADSLNRMGQTLARHGFQLRVHHHTPQLEDKAREWTHILRNTDPEYVHICVDVDWAYQGGFEPVAFLRNVGDRLREIHVRSARNKLWLEDLEDSDIDYRKVADYLIDEKLDPLVVVELAYRPTTLITRPLEEDLRRSRLYAERIFSDIR